MKRIFSQPSNQPNAKSLLAGQESEAARRARQIKEVLRLGNAMRAELQLDILLRQIVEAISSCIGFRQAILNLVHDDSPDLECAAFVGISSEDERRMRASPPPLTRLLGMMRSEFRLSQSYFIPHEHAHLVNGMQVVTPKNITWHGENSWHPQDILLVPLVSPRENKLLGILSLDDPEDGLQPSLETIEVIELFANQAALGIDNARVFQQREQERRALELAIFDLLEEVEQARQGNLTVRARISETSLGAVADSLNEMLRALNAVLLEVRQATNVVSKSASDLQMAAWRLAAGAQQQERQVNDIFKTIREMAASVQQVSDNAATAAGVAHNALEITNEGRQGVERAVQGMNAVREMVLQSAKKIKRLGESSQEIGEIVQLISDFASKTNLLALNASIEAVRAGEHGRGFSAVAQEIRNLANSSAEATKQISATIKSIQNETNAVVVSMEQSTQQVVIQSGMAAHAGSALQAMDAIMQRIVQHIEGISSAAAQQAAAGGSVARAMGDIAQITVYTARNIDQMHASMGRLTELAESLQRRVGVFQLSEDDTSRHKSVQGKTSGSISNPLLARHTGEMRAEETPEQSAIREK
ncbi:MAG TPA: methyl-accepting chemotaxis protein [Ktedonobacterales bacterium]|nr:methyl-accepting chemotaxis protein [Ktedonobacterales bacterium]